MKALVKMGALVAICAVALFLSASQARATIIDHFIDDIADLQVNNVTTDQFDCSTGLANVLGGTRKVHLKWNAGDSGPNSEATITTVGTDHFLDFSNPTDGVNWSTTLTLKYDADPTPATDNGSENGHFDLSDCDFLEIGMLGADTKTNAHWTLVDQDSSSTVDVAIPVIPFITPTTLITPFASFTGINFADLKSIQLVIDGPNAGDYRVDFIGCDTVIPEPLTMLGLFMGLGGVGAYIRKRRMM